MTLSSEGRQPDNEFDIIRHCFEPLAAKHPGALSLKDDAAVLPIEPGNDLVMTMDTVVAGVHFFANDPPQSIAAKVLGVNLSDLAAMGADPYVFTLSVALNRQTSVSWLETFAQSLHHYQDLYHIVLVGGDTVRTPGPTSLTINATGLVPIGKAIKRSGAKIGDTIYVSGVIGEGALGLMALRGEKIGLGADALACCIEKYRFPKPRLALGKALRGVASSAIDVSDGLIQDLGHICATSKVGARLDLANIPLPIGIDSPLLPKVLNGGDDYELVFTIPHESDDLIQEALKTCGIPVHRIGTIVAKPDIEVRHLGRTLENLAKDGGYNHFEG